MAGPITPNLDLAGIRVGANEQRVLGDELQEAGPENTLWTNNLQDCTALAIVNRNNGRRFLAHINGGWYSEPVMDRIAQRISGENLTVIVANGALGSSSLQEFRQNHMPLAKSAFEAAMKKAKKMPSGLEYGDLWTNWREDPASAGTFAIQPDGAYGRIRKEGSKKGCIIS